MFLLVFTFQSTLFTCCGQNRLQKYSEVKGTSDKSSLPTHLISKKEYMHYISNHHDIGGTPFSHVCTQEFQPLGYCSQLTYVDIGFLCFHLCQLQNFLLCEKKKSFELQIIYDQARMIVKIIYQVPIPKCFFSGDAYYQHS